MPNMEREWTTTVALRAALNAAGPDELAIAVMTVRDMANTMPRACPLLGALADYLAEIKRVRMEEDGEPDTETEIVAATSWAGPHPHLAFDLDFRADAVADLWHVTANTERARDFLRTASNQKHANEWSTTIAFGNYLREEAFRLGLSVFAHSRDPVVR